MGVLDSVLQYKQRKDAEASADLQAIPAAMATFQQSRQQAQKTLLDQLTLDLAYAKAPYEIAKLKGEAGKAQAETGLLEKFFNPQQGQPTVTPEGQLQEPQYEIPEVSIGGAKIVNVAAQRRIQQGELEQKNIGEARQKLDEYVPQANAALVALDKIEKYAKELPEFKTGVGEQTKARFEAGVATYAKDPKFTRYLGAIAQELSPLARSLAEEKGPLTNRDIDRIEVGLGDKTLPLSERTVLLNEYRDKVTQAIRAKSEVAKVPLDDITQKYPSLAQRLLKKEGGAPPSGAAYFSKSTGKYYDQSGKEL